MPDFWTHILGGELVLKDLEQENIEENIRENRRIFYFGCQGPDFFFYNDFWPWIKNKRGPEAGKKIHEADFRSFFSCSMDYIQVDKLNLLKVYFYGVLCHYVFDKYLHPFIYARTSNFPEHKKLESSLDILLVDELWQEKAFKLFPVTAIDIGDELPVEIEDYYRYVLSTLFDYSPQVDFINDSYIDMKRVLSIFYCPEKLKRSGIMLLNKLLPLDISIYLYPETIEYNFLSEGEKTEIYTLLKKASREGIDLIKMVNKGAFSDLIDFLPRVSFTGK